MNKGYAGNGLATAAIEVLTLSFFIDDEDIVWSTTVKVSRALREMGKEVVFNTHAKHPAPRSCILFTIKMNEDIKICLKNI